MKTMQKSYKSVLTIAGSDSGGCAGIQGDIKSISSCGAYASTVITASTAQNTKGVFDIYPISINHIEKQLDAVLSDIKFGSVKIGMLYSSEIINCVKLKLESYKVKNIVIDPVMISSSGYKLISNDAIKTLKLFLRRATIITPNIPEAEILIDKKINIQNIQNSAKIIGKLFSTSVLLKGGHLVDEGKFVTDILYDFKSNSNLIIKNTKIKSNNLHGTGCSLSSSIAAFLSLGFELDQAVKNACNFVNRAIKNGDNKILGQGIGPINHFNI